MSCPTAVDYEDRIQALAKQYAAKNVAVVAVCVNRVSEDSLPALTERAEQKQFEFAYLYDESQQIAKKYGAIFTPEFFVLDRHRDDEASLAFDGATNLSLSPAMAVDGEEASSAQSTGPPHLTASAKISSYDWGAHGVLVVRAQLEDGQSITGHMIDGSDRVLICC